MSPAKRDFVFYLEDIKVAIEKIMECTQDIPDVQSLETDWLRYDAILRNLEIIGEASHKISDAVKIQFPEIPWADMYRTRNIISHQYFGIDSDIIWRIITNHLPSNLLEIKEIIEFYKN
jgi:uncharacterized protein with HEPN domain